MYMARRVLPSLLNLGQPRLLLLLPHLQLLNHALGCSAASARAPGEGHPEGTRSAASHTQVKSEVRLPRATQEPRTRVVQNAQNKARITINNVLESYLLNAFSFNQLVACYPELLSQSKCTLMGWFLIIDRCQFIFFKVLINLNIFLHLTLVFQNLAQASLLLRSLPDFLAR